MSRFDIVRNDPQEFKNWIIELWKEFLPGTPAARFEWMNQGNPAGAAWWYFAFEKGSGELAGVISIMPKTMYLNGSTLRAGILGDFMVPKKYRVFGPGLMLPKVAINESLTQRFDFIYTIPNSDSRKIIEKAGMINGKTIHHLIKPTLLKPYLNQYVPTWLAGLIAPFGNMALRAITDEAYGRGQVVVREETDVDVSFDVLWDIVRRRQVGLIGDRCAEYLRWKCLQNPLAVYRLITARNKINHELRGYLFFQIEGGKMEIYDLLILDQQSQLSLIRKAAQIARAERCQAMYLRLDADNPMSPLLSKCWFLDAHDDITILNCSRTTFSTNAWYFLSGDRNI